MDLPRLAIYSRTWAQYPPVHVTLAHLGRSFGVLKPYVAPARPGVAPSDQQDLGELMQHFPLMPSDADSAQMTPAELDDHLDRLFFGQTVKASL